MLKQWSCEDYALVILIWTLPQSHYDNCASCLPVRSDCHTAFRKPVHFIVMTVTVVIRPLSTEFLRDGRSPPYP